MFNFVDTRQDDDDNETLVDINQGPALLRIQSDIKDLDLPNGCTLHYTKNKMEYIVHVNLSEGTYKNQNLKFLFQFKQEYPFKPPRVLFLGQIYHPNIDVGGGVCLNILRLGWNPILNFNAILYGVINILLDPQPEEPLNKDAASDLEKDRQLYENNCATCIKGGEIHGVFYPGLI